jgi:hypothetical protein
LEKKTKEKEAMKGKKTMIVKFNWRRRRRRRRRRLSSLIGGEDEGEGDEGKGDDNSQV